MQVIQLVMDPIPVLSVDEIIRKSDAGMTEPFLCELSDKNRYYVKGRSALLKGCIAEVVCAELGRNFGLPIPEYVIADVELELVRYNPEAMSKLGVGYWFASRLADGLTEVKISDLVTFEETLLKKIFVFDTWIKNEDRTGTPQGGNPNLFFAAATNELVVIDHNQAFDANFIFSDVKNLHICRNYWFSNPQDLLLRETFEPQMQVAFEKMRDYEEYLPAKWVEEEAKFLEFVDATLERYSHDEFWEPLTWEK